MRINEADLGELMEMAGRAGAEAYRNEEENAAGKRLNRNLSNTRKLLESYRTLKNDLQHSKYEDPEEQVQLRFSALEDLMSPSKGESTRTEQLMADEIARLQNNAWRLYQIDRALALLKEDCEHQLKPEAMRKYRVLVAMYIDDEIITQEEIAEREFVSDRTVRGDLREALKMITPYIFSIESILEQK